MTYLTKPEFCLVNMNSLWFSDTNIITKNFTDVDYSFGFHIADIGFLGSPAYDFRGSEANCVIRHCS